MQTGRASEWLKYFNSVIKLKDSEMIVAFSRVPTEIEDSQKEEIQNQNNLRESD